MSDQTETAKPVVRGEVPEPEWLTGLRETMTAELTGTSGTISESVHTAVRVASYYLRPVHAELAGEKRKVADPEELTKTKLPAPAPVVREVPAKERQAGDRFTITGEVGEYRASPVGEMQPGDVHITGWGGEDVYLYNTTVTVTRPVSPLPDQPGAVGTATVRGVKGVRVMLRAKGDWQSAIPCQNRTQHNPEHLTDYVVELDAPAGAGMDEGGKR